MAEDVQLGGNLITDDRPLAVEQQGAIAVEEPVTIDGDVDIHVEGVAPQLDDTDKLAVSVYGQDAAPGDIALNASAAGNLEVDIHAMPGLAAARAGTAFCRKVNKKAGINGAATVLTDAGLIQTTLAGYRDVVTCIYAYLSTASDDCEFEIGYTVNADGTGGFTAMTPMFGLVTGANNQAPSPALTPFDPPIVITPAMGGAWTIRAQTNDAGAAVTFGMNGWREAIP